MHGPGVSFRNKSKKRTAIHVLSRFTMFLGRFCSCQTSFFLNIMSAKPLDWCLDYYFRERERECESFKSKDILFCPCCGVLHEPMSAWFMLMTVKSRQWSSLPLENPLNAAKSFNSPQKESSNLLNMRPLLVGWRRRPSSLLGWRSSLLGGMPSLLGRRRVGGQCYQVGGHH